MYVLFSCTRSGNNCNRNKILTDQSVDSEITF